MTTFLQELARQINANYPNWDQLTVVFPNRRAALYFRNELKKNLPTAKWAPTIVTIEDFISQFASLQVADKFNLVIRLYQSYKSVNPTSEGIDKFYYWGEMLLRDFDELDKYLVDTKLLFRDVSNLKEVEQYFDYLTDEQKEFLKEFWQTVEFSKEETKLRFLELWRSLRSVYEHFTKSLLQDGVAYEGLIHRMVAEKLRNEKPDFYSQRLVFAGFYALTKAEEEIISWFVANADAKVYWDEDDFYVSQDYREAGNFLRLYRNHSILGKTFAQRPPENLASKKNISLRGVPQKAGQPKLLAQYLEYLSPAQQEKTVVVLPDESMLLPVLYSLPANLGAVNVTMGYPLVNTPFFSLIDFVFELHRTKRKNEFFYRAVLNLLNHPHIKAVAGEESSAIQVEIKKQNRVQLGDDYFSTRSPFIASLFRTVHAAEFIDYVLALVEQMASLPQSNIFEQEFAFHFHRILTKLKKLSQSEKFELEMLQRLFRQMIRLEKVPFVGEPLQGVQIMGVLETRNLDFENVFVLSMNEGMWPAAAKHGSYIPYSIRKAYGLPTPQHQDALYSYLFYRLLQRPQSISLFYNTEPNVVGGGEMSRYLQQIIFDTGWPHEKKVLYSSVSIKPPQPIVIEKNGRIMERLASFENIALTPSALNAYLDCSLRFYFRQIVGLREQYDVEETTDARVFGNIFHRVMEMFYMDIKPKSGEWRVEERHFENTDFKLDELMERAYREHFHLNEKKEVRYEGQQLVVNEMVNRLAGNVLTKDSEHAPFVIEVVEAKDYSTSFSVSENLTVLLGGKIDRVDRKDNLVRIIDYKTGSDDNKFESVESLFDGENKKRNKAAFQALMYAWVYARKNEGSHQLQPGLLNRKDLFRTDFQYGLQLDRHIMNDVTPLLGDFETHLIKLLENIFDKKQSFVQTDDEKKCMYCAYKEICGR